MPELKKNILNFGYGINFKYEGMLAHSFDRVYVATKFILPIINDLKFLPIDFNEKCDYFNADLSTNHYCKEYITNEKTIPFKDFYTKHIFSYNHMLHKILNKISLILPNFPKARQEKRSIIALLTGFIGLVYEDISSYLHNIRQKGLHKAFVAMENKVNIQCNKIIYLENSMVMYGIYNSKASEKLIDTVHEMHNITTWNGKLFAGNHVSWYNWYLSTDRIGNYAINSCLYL